MTLPLDIKDSLLEGLNQRQKDVVVSSRGSFLVSAGFGTGKTEVLARRAAYAIHEDVLPSKMLCLTYTNKAADELKKRVESMAGHQAKEISIKTFHSFCLSIRGMLGLSTHFSVYDSEDVKLVLEQILLEESFPKGMINKGLLASLQTFLELYYIEIYSKKKEKQRLLKEIFSESLYNNATSSTISYYNNWWSESKLKNLLNIYQKNLFQNAALDFNTIIADVLDALRVNKGYQKMISKLFSWIQIDEAQDMNVPQFWIVFLIAEHSHNIAIFGDIYQTIYRWRGSRPEQIFSRFRNRFSPQEVSFDQRYRSKEAIATLADKIIPAQGIEGDKLRKVDSGREALKICKRKNIQEEAAFIAESIKTFHQQNIRFSDIAIITRTRHIGETIAEVLLKESIPYRVQDEYNFFQKPSIKMVLSGLQLLFNPNDSIAAKTLLRDILDDKREYQEKSSSVGLFLSDFITENVEDGDIFQNIITGFESDNLIAFDLETTGKDVRRDNIIEISAVQFGKGGIKHKYASLINHDDLNIRGNSENIHGISIEEIKKEGGSFKEVMSHFLEMVNGKVVFAHNAFGFDIPVLNRELDEHNLSFFSPSKVYDTLDLFRRFFDIEKFSLSFLCEHFNVTSIPSHRALDDSKALAEVISKKLIDQVKKDVHRRQIFLKKNEQLVKQTHDIRELYREWQRDLKQKPLGALIDKIVRDVIPQEKEKEKVHIAKMKEIILSMSKDNLLSLHDLYHNFILSKNYINEMTNSENRDEVLILTCHQSKGTEFRVVFIPGLNDGEFPHWKSDIEDEKNVFYVAVTRAKEILIISYHEEKEKKNQQRKIVISPASRSPFLNLLEEG